MGLFDRLLNKKEYTDEQIVSVCTGKKIDTKSIADPMFANETLGKTFAVEPEENTFVSPVNGTLEVLFPTGHAYGVRGNDGTAYLVHIGIDTVNLRGKGFTLYKNKGDSVKAGERIIKADLNTIKQANYKATTMLIVTEPIEGKEYSFADLDSVKAGDLINQK